MSGGDGSPSRRQPEPSTPGDAMRNTPTTDEQAQANLQATKALLGLQQRGYLYAAERRSFGWIAVIKKGTPPVVMHSATGRSEERRVGQECRDRGWRRDGK